MPAAGAALVVLQPEEQESQQSLLRRKRLHRRFNKPSSQPQSPQPQLEPQLVLLEQPQESLEWNRLKSLLRHDSRHESQLEQLVVHVELQLVVQEGWHVVVQAGLQLSQVSHPQLE